MSLHHNINESGEANELDSLHDDEGEIFSKTLSKLIENKFKFSSAEAILERKPKADKGV